MPKDTSLGFTASRYSTLSEWMKKNRKQIAIELKEADRPNWDEITLLLNSLGLKDAKGNSVTKQTARLTWRYLEKGRSGRSINKINDETLVPQNMPTQTKPVANDANAAMLRLEKAISKVSK